MAGSGILSVDPTDYLCVDAFLGTIVDAKALETALELGLIDRLLEPGAHDPDRLAAALGIDEPALALLLGLLRANQVVADVAGNVQLTPRFARALAYRDLLETKLALAAFVLPDFAEGFTDLIRQPDRFRSNARVFELFSYDASENYGANTHAITKRWMRITTCLTKYEAGVCLARHDFSPYARILDIGGNSGEFVLQICKRHPHVRATVVDLPVVCDIGRQHVGSHPEAGRIAFVRANAFTEDLPEGFDLIMFKSMLHDWPEDAVQHLMARAVRCLAPGGAVLIFERGPFRPEDRVPRFATIPFLLFFRSFRPPGVYEQILAKLGFGHVQVQWIDLEMPFFLLVARNGPRP